MVRPAKLYASIPEFASRTISCRYEEIKLAFWPACGSWQANCVVVDNSDDYRCSNFCGADQKMEVIATNLPFRQYQRRTT